MNMFSSFSTALQAPPEIPNPTDEPAIDFSNPADIILFIILPLVVVFLYILWRGRKNNEKK